MDGETPTTGVQICEGVGSRRRHVFYSRLTMLSWLLYVCFDPQKKKLYVCFELVWTSWFAEQEAVMSKLWWWCLKERRPGQLAIIDGPQRLSNVGDGLSWQYLFNY